MQDFQVPGQPGDIVETENFKITRGDFRYEDCQPNVLEAALGYKRLFDLEQLIQAGVLEWLDTQQVLKRLFCQIYRLLLILITREIGYSPT